MKHTLNGLRIIVILSLFGFLADTHSAWFTNFWSKPAENTASSNTIEDVIGDFEEINNAEVARKSIDYNALAKNEWIATQNIIGEFGIHAFDKQQSLNNIGIHEAGVRTHELFVPQNCQANTKPIVLILVHGTFSQESASYYSTEKNFYKSVREFAAKTANEKQSPIELISFRWEGKNSSAARKNGAVKLASLITERYANSKTMTIAHSHGCNLVNNASTILPNGVTIDHIVNIAAPVRDNSDVDFKPANFNKLTQFYSTSDNVAAAGSLTGTLQDIYAGGSIRKFASQDGKKITNVRTQINGYDPGHGNIKVLITYLDTILNTIENQYRFNCDLDLDICLDQPVTNPVLMSVRHYKTAPNNTEYAIAEQQALEYAFSENQKGIFKSRYGKNMEVKNSMIRRFISGAFQEISGMFGYGYGF